MFLWSAGKRACDYPRADMNRAAFTQYPRQLVQRCARGHYIINDGNMLSV
jgi:hypothetical protein